MNPPFGGTTGSNNIIDFQFITKVNKICDNVIVISPNRMDSKRSSLHDMYKEKHIKSIELVESRKAFDIVPVGIKYLSIQDFDNNKTFDKAEIIVDDKKYLVDISDYDNRIKFLRQLDYSEGINNLIEKTKPLYNELLRNYKTMCHDTDYFIYEENKDGMRGVRKAGQKKLERVKYYLKTGKYKYCIYKGSGNNKYDKPQVWTGQNPDDLFDGQICWLTNKENVKNNIIYWMESPLFDLWRMYYFNECKYAACYRYTMIPALNFDQSETSFKKYVDSLNDFTPDEIKTLKDNNIHNADKL